MRKDDPLNKYLRSVGQRQHVQMTFGQIEKVLKESLPKSAYSYREWWANQKNTRHRPEAQSWLEAGFVVSKVNQTSEGGSVEFVRL